MSSSASVQAARHDRVEAFRYPAEESVPSPWSDWVAEMHAVDLETQDAAECAPSAEFLERLEADKAEAFEAGRRQGMEEGSHVQSAAQDSAEHRRGQQLEQLTQAFAAEQGRIAEKLEEEVVRLALALSARILRREAQTDPLLLAGAVRVALGQLAGSAKARLRVPAAEAKLWSEWVPMVPNLRTSIVVEPVEGMRLGDCELETDLGSVDLGVRAQLREIEGAFFESAPRAVPPSSAPSFALSSAIGARLP